MRMGLGADDSVLDPNAEARWMKRLFVPDKSALANSLGGPNPTLTTQALATRTAEKIFERYFDGEPWVGREASRRSTWRSRKRSCSGVSEVVPTVDRVPTSSSSRSLTASGHWRMSAAIAASLSPVTATHSCSGHSSPRKSPRRSARTPLCSMARSAVWSLTDAPTSRSFRGLLERVLLNV
jgi:GMC oxidoreductase